MDSSWATAWTSGDQFSQESRIMFIITTTKSGLWPAPPSIQQAHVFFPRKQSGLRVKAATNVHLAARLIMRESTPRRFRTSWLCDSEPQRRAEHENRTINTCRGSTPSQLSVRDTVRFLCQKEPGNQGSLLHVLPLPSPFTSCCVLLKGQTDLLQNYKFQCNSCAVDT
jgi:hypothetical protein